MDLQRQKDKMKPLHDTAAAWLMAIFSAGNLLRALIVLNIAFFAVSIFRPGYKLFTEVYSLGEAVERLGDTLIELEGSSGVTINQLPQHIERRFGDLYQASFASQRNTEVIARALNNPMAITFTYAWIDSDFDCLGNIESVFRELNPNAVSSSPNVRFVTVRGPL